MRIEHSLSTAQSRAEALKLLHNKQEKSCFPVGKVWNASAWLPIIKLALTARRKVMINTGIVISGKGSRGSDKKLQFRAVRSLIAFKYSSYRQTCPMFAKGVLDKVLLIIGPPFSLAVYFSSLENYFRTYSGQPSLARARAHAHGERRINWI